MIQKPKRVIGADERWNPIYPAKDAHSFTIAPSGAGKTSGWVMPSLLSTVHIPSNAILINDPKSGEIAAQCAEPVAKMGRKVAIIDDDNALGDNPFKLNLSPFGSFLEALRHHREEMIFATENICNVLIPDPPEGSGDKNQYFRDWPKSLIEFAMLMLARRNIALTTPGGVWVALSDPEMLVRMARVEADEADGQLAALGREIVEMATGNPEHWSQHRAAATKVLRIYSEDARLHTCGVGAELTHSDLIAGKYVIFLVGNQKNIHRMRAHYGMHIQSFLDAIYSGAGPIDMYLDEITNTPLKSLVSAITTLRGFKANVHIAAQSVSELVRNFGQKETDTLLENMDLKSYFGFGSFEEARKVSEAIGDQDVLNTSFGLSSKDLTYSKTYSSAKERILSPADLMRMPKTHQLVHASGVGWFMARKVFQNQIAPWCTEGLLADNPLEGPQLPPDPRITIKM